MWEVREVELLGSTLLQGRGEADRAGQEAKL